MEKRELTEQMINNLIETAKNALKQAYVPYSNYPVGSAMLTSGGEILSGCNVENASYGLTNCAERTAIFKAVSEGGRDIAAMAITAESENYASPCGACRQVIMEFGPEAWIILANKNNDYQLVKAKELLPGAFTSSELKS